MIIADGLLALNEAHSKMTQALLRDAGRLALGQLPENLSSTASIERERVAYLGQAIDAANEWLKFAAQRYPLERLPVCDWWVVSPKSLEPVRLPWLTLSREMIDWANTVQSGHLIMLQSGELQAFDRQLILVREADFKRLRDHAVADARHKARRPQPGRITLAELRQWHSSIGDAGRDSIASLWDRAKQDFPNRSVPEKMVRELCRGRRRGRPTT